MDGYPSCATHCCRALVPTQAKSQGENEDEMEVVIFPEKYGDVRICVYIHMYICNSGETLEALLERVRAC